MRFNLLPNGNIFYDLLINLSLKAQEGVKSFKLFIQSNEISNNNLEKMRDLEHEADQIVHQIMVKLNKTFITPIDREDIHQLAKKIDDLMDIVYTLSGRMVIFHIKDIRNYLKQMVDILEQAADCVVMAMQKIERLKNLENLFDLFIQIHTLENQGDRFFEKAIEDLFQQEKDPIEVIKWKEIYDFLELAIDKCEDIADIVWTIAVKYG